MSDLIRILPDDLANKIAAGEVVERPSSVVKELVENALDVGSTRITVEIRAGGKQLIRVIDNGNGMSREDARLAFARHATSKITSVEDLSQIGTFGFRGEALPSIASIARVEMVTNTAEGIAGTRIRIDGGETLEVEDAGRATGTTITVSHLFYNVPARRKFLRGADTEQRHIVGILTSAALGCPETGFTLMADGREAITLPPVTNFYARARDVVGDTVMNQMIPVAFEDPFVRISGFISRPDAARIARTNQHLFINLRPITNRTVNHAVYEGYGSLLPKERYPFTILYLSIDLDQVDVNVHPGKKEVRFTNDAFIYERVMRAVRLALQSSDIVPVFQTDTPMIRAAASSGSLPIPESRSGFSGTPRQRSQIDLFTAMSQVPHTPSATWEYTPGAPVDPGDTERQPPPPAQEGPTEPTPVESGMVSLWQLNHAYIFASIKGGLVVVDQHAAHERVLFEKSLSAIGTSSPGSQQLLFPITVDLTLPQFALVKEHIEWFERLGFVMKLFGGQTVVIDAVPALGQPHNGETLFQQIVDELEHPPVADLNPEERVALAFASRAGITKGVPLSQQEMNALMNDLFATSMPYVSPHGRPILVRMSMEEIERKFNKR